MSVVLSKNPAFWAPGFLVIPDGDGQFTFEYRARFKRLPTERQKEILAQLEENRLATLAGKPLVLTDKQLLDEVLVDWEGFKDADGDIVVYSPANRDQACAEWFGLEASFSRAYLRAAWPEQIKKEAEKN